MGTICVIAFSEFSLAVVPAQQHPQTTYVLHGGEWGWLEGAPGQYRPPNLILTQSLHLKYTCSKHAVSNSSFLYTLFYSVVYNSVLAPLFEEGFWCDPYQLRGDFLQFVIRPVGSVISFTSSFFIRLFLIQ